MGRLGEAGLALGEQRLGSHRRAQAFLTIHAPNFVSKDYLDFTQRFLVFRRVSAKRPGGGITMGLPMIRSSFLGHLVKSFLADQIDRGQKGFPRVASPQPLRGLEEQSLQKRWYNRTIVIG